MYFISCCFTFHKVNLSPMGNVSFRLWQHYLFYLLAVDLYIFNKRQLAGKSLLEIVLSWECLSVLQRDPELPGLGERHKRLGVRNSHKLHSGRDLWVCQVYSELMVAHFFQKPVLLSSPIPVSSSLHSLPNQLKWASVLQLLIYHTNCVSWSQCQQQEFPMVSAFFCKMSVIFGKWTATDRVSGENNRNLNCSTMWDHSNPFASWLFLSLEYILNTSVESLGKHVILSKPAEVNEWK